MSIQAESSTFQLTKALRLEIDDEGRLLAFHSLSRLPVHVEIDALPVLMAFSQPDTPASVLQRLKKDWDFDEAGFNLVVRYLTVQQLLVNAENNEGDLSDGGFGNVLHHHRMLRDRRRTQCYQAAIQSLCSGKEVVEIGCGSGILSVFAAKAGARHVTAIEETRIATLARRIFEANDMSDLITLEVGNSLDVELKRRADVIIHELFGNDPFAENMLTTLADARRRFLKPGGIFLPSRVQVCCVGVDVGSDPETHRQESIAQIENYASGYAVNLDPLIQALAHLDIKEFRRPLVIKGRDGRFQGKILSEECLIYDIDLQKDESSLNEPRISHLEINEPGRLGYLLVYFRAYLNSQQVLSNGPLEPKTHWARDVRTLQEIRDVEPGDRVPIRVNIEERGGRQRMAATLAGPEFSREG